MGVLLQFFLILFFLSSGLLLAIATFMPSFCQWVSLLFITHRWILFLIGSSFFFISVLFLGGWIYRRRHRTMRLVVKPHPVDIGPEVIRKLLIEELKKNMTEITLDVNVRFKLKKRLEIELLVPKMDKKEQEDLLGKSQEYVSHILYNQIGFKQAFILTVVS